MRSFKEARHDPHRPSVLDPAEYLYVGCADDHADDSYFEIDHERLRKHGVDTGQSNYRSGEGVPWYDATVDGRPNYRCHHCGKHGSNIRYFVFFLHKPSNVVITVGQICAKKLNLGTKEELDLQKRANAFRKMRERSEWADRHAAEYDFLKNYDEAHRNGGRYNEFYESLWKAIGTYGSLTEKQLAALTKGIEREKQWRAERAENPRTQSHGITDPQKRYITSLVRGRQMSDEARTKALAMLETGLTKKAASAWIDKLLSLPERA